jgi:hypothetical protein
MTTSHEPVFIVADYSATGEGRTISILITRAYPRQADYEQFPSYTIDPDGKGTFEPGRLSNSAEFRAMREFAELFDGYTASGAATLDQETFLKTAGKYVPEFVVRMLEERAGNLHYHSQFHINFS